MQLLNLVKEEKAIEQKMENLQSDKLDLIEQKEIIENRIKRMERKHSDDKIKDSLRKLEEVAHAVSDIQLSLNLVWKRTKQIEEELKEALN